ncbi:MAG: type III-B CRISPR module RAMP protein Cmr1 [Acidobacteria bacterium]|nr:type III-B CRISPR module RAMP protein Cmr1 [Acidobacteriota bacterium]MBI3657020.1 type III-B CRISPR module RAMP protein Cmr1 [Acidobacteriota bacterium]
MSRTIIGCPDAPIIQVDLKAGIDGYHPNTIPKTYAIQVITPIFGGGTEPGINDPVTLIRPSSIRGHLRFWWRATQGAKCSRVKELRRREGEIWGTTDNTSAVSVKVSINPQKPGHVEPCAVFERDRNGYYKSFPTFRPNYPAYALFPFQGKKPDGTEAKAPSSGTVNTEFYLTVHFPQDMVKDVEAAVWAWVNFGGIGARPRRGCGALYCNDFAPPAADRMGEWFKSAQHLYELPTTQHAREWPTLTTMPLVSKQMHLPMEAWSLAVGLMREFRQGVGIGRNPGRQQNRPGRSRWPEPDALRAFTGQGSLEHLSSMTLQELGENPAFPRAEFGLPIVFHFKDKEDSPNNSELYPEDAKRMASPIILRPLAIKSTNKAVVMVLRLAAPAPTALELKNKKKAPEIKARHIRRSELAAYQNSPMANRSNDGSALEAFIAYAKEKGFKEVTP